MKNLVKLLAIAVGFTIVLSSCSNSLFSSGMIADSNDSVISAENKVKGLGFSVASEAGLINFGSSRTIVPGAIDIDDLDLYMWGTNDITQSSIVSDKNFLTSKGAEPDFTFTGEGETPSKTKGTINISLDISKYTLHLAAILKTNAASITDAASIINNAVMLADTVVDLRNNEEINFYLSPNNINGKGSVKLAVYSKWDATTLGYSTKIGIYDKVTGSKLGASYELPSTATPAAINLYSNYDSTGASKPFGEESAVAPTKWAKAINFQPAESYAAGTYNFVATFTETAPASGAPAKVFYWSDTIVILANQTTEAAVLVPDVIEKAPAAPTSLTVGYSDPAAFDASYYTVEFDWEDNANNETGFILDLLDISNGSSDIDTNVAVVMNASSTLAAKNTAWSELSAVTTVKSLSFDKGIYETYTDYVAGSLDKNAKQLLISLPLGSRYLARLSAVNDAGVEKDAESNLKYLYATVSSLVNSFSYSGVTIGTTPATNGVARTITAKAWEGTDDDAPLCINRYRVSYNLTGGAFYTCGNDGVPTTSGNPPVRADVTASTTAGSAVFTTGTDINAQKTLAVVYYNVTKNGLEIINPIAYEWKSGSKASLYNGDNKWTSWKVDDKDKGKDFNMTSTEDAALLYTNPYLHYENLQLFAAYQKQSANVSMYNVADENITAENVKVLSNTTSSEGTGSAVTVTDGQLTVSIAKPNDTDPAISYLIFELIDENEVYTDARIYFSKTSGYESYDNGIPGERKPVDDKATWVFPVPVGGKKAGIYNVIIKASSKKKPSGYTYPLTVTITE